MRTISFPGTANGVRRVALLAPLPKPTLSAMPTRRKSFPRTRFPAAIVKTLVERWAHAAGLHDLMIGYNEIALHEGDERSYDSLDQWLDQYRREPGACTLSLLSQDQSSQFWYYQDPIHGSSVNLGLPNAEAVDALVDYLEELAPGYPESRGAESISAISEQLMESSAPTQRPCIFIGHGGKSTAWRVLALRLQGLGYRVEEFSSSTRAGRSVTDVLQSMLDVAQMAFLIHTPEDEFEPGNFRARENVIHETGMFQGRLGFTKAIIVRESGAESFSNIDGLQEIRFSNEIESVMGQIIDVLRREFGALPAR
jgi:hypothetical protein